MTNMLTQAFVQCGEKPPYRLFEIPVRMNDENGMPQIWHKGDWIDFPYEGPRPTIEKYSGMPVVGISATWLMS